MNKRLICIFLTVFALLLGTVYLWAQFASQEAKEKQGVVLIPEEREENTEEPKQPTPTVPVNRAVEKEMFYLVVEDGYLSVYRGRDTFYAYTDIRFDRLDESTKTQIQEGLSFSDERSLYDFLENHSS